MENDMIEMEYKKERLFRIIAAGSYKNIKYWIVSMGTHPCAYVEATDLPEYFFHDAPVHGGFTYDEDHLLNVWNEAFKGFKHGKRHFVGWDYAHLGDYNDSVLGPAINGKKWTTEEILLEVKKVINNGMKNIKKAKGE